MDALKKNKFLTTYLIAVVAGALVFGWFLWSSFSKHKAARAELTATQDAVRSLESRPLYPNADNFRKRKEQVDQFAGKVSELQSTLLAYQKPINEAPDETKFQNKLTETIKDLKAQAEVTKLGGSGTAGSGEFDLGMGKYLQEIPRRDTVPDLEFQLDGIKRVVEIMLTDRVSSIDAISRAELAVEAEKPDAATPAPGARAPARSASGASRKPATGPAPALPEDKVLKRYPFTVKFTGTPQSVKEVLNHLASTKEQFFAVRQLRLENEKKEGPDKGATSSASSSDDAASKKDSTVILGGEKVTAAVAIDLLRFMPPEAAAKSTVSATR